MRYEPRDEDIVSLPPYRGIPLKMYLPDRNDGIQAEKRGTGTTGQEILLDRALSYVPMFPSVVDVGAHVGTTVFWFYQKAGARHVTAIEPGEYTRSILEANLVLNGISNRVDVVGAAAGAREGYARLAFTNPNNTGTDTYRECPQSDEAVPVVTLDGILAGVTGRVDVIKLDAEGSEADVLEGARKLIGRDRPAIFIEIWRPGIRVLDPGYDTADGYVRTIGKLAELDYVVAERLDDDNYLFVPAERA